MTEERKNNRRIATNTLNEYMNEVVPLIKERLSKGYKLKDDGSLYKKDKVDIDRILDENRPINTIRAYINSSEWTNWLVVDIHYHEEKDSHYVVYLKDSHFLFGNSDGFVREYNVRPIYEEHQVETARCELATIDVKLSVLKEQKSKVENKFRNFIKGSK